MSLSEDIIDGKICQVCHTFVFPIPSGHPVTCPECFPDGIEDGFSDEEQRRRRHIRWQVDNIEIIERAKLKYDARTNGWALTMLFREPGKPKVNFWCSTGRWQDLETKRVYGGGARKFLEWYKKQGG
jgi:hypothetical protein